MPTGSLCAERNVIGTALSADITLRRQDIKIVAVYSASMPSSANNMLRAHSHTSSSREEQIGMAYSDGSSASASATESDAAAAARYALANTAVHGEGGAAVTSTMKRNVALFRSDSTADTVVGTPERRPDNLDENAAEHNNSSNSSLLSINTSEAMVYSASTAAGPSTSTN